MRILNHKFQQQLKLLCLLMFLSQTGLSQNETNDTIFWNPNIKLQISDFKKEAIGDYPKGYSALSNISIHLRFDSNSIEGIQVRAFFIKSKSWMFNFSENDEIGQLLTHEKLHLDIAQIFADRIKKVILSSNLSIEDYDEIKEIFDAKYAEYDDFSEEFDNQTSFGSNFEAQQRIANEIKNELLKIHDFSSSDN